MPSVDGRVVSMEDGLDPEADDFNLGSFIDETMQRNLPEFCSNKCNEDALVNTYNESEMISNQICNRTKALACSETTGVAYISRSDMYSSVSRSTSLELKGGSRSRRTLSIERHNYAKALIHSDDELELLALKIRKEIRESEIIELAREAERAADAGQSKFFGRASTFGDNMDPSRSNQSSPLVLRHPQTFSEGNTSADFQSIEQKKIKVLALRNIGEVIPQWTTLHSHLRTHLFRKGVDEESLMYRELKCSSTMQPKEERKMERKHTSSNIAQKPFDFFENIAGVTMKRLATQGRAACKPTVCEESVDNQSETCRPSKPLRVESTPPAFLSLKSEVKTAPVFVPFGNLHSDENNTFSSPETLCRMGTSEEDHDNRESALNQPSPTSTGSLKVIKDKLDDKTDDTPSTMRVSMEEPIAPVPLFDTKDMPSYPVSSLRHLGSTATTQSPTNIDTDILTPRKNPSRKSNPQYVMPSGLRDMSGQNKGSAAEENLSTPEITKSTFEPSSIIEIGESAHDLDDKLSLTPLHEQSAKFLALPVIYDMPNGTPGDGCRQCTETDTKCKLTMPQRCPPPNTHNRVDGLYHSLQLEDQRYKGRMLPKVYGNISSVKRPEDVKQETEDLDKDSFWSLKGCPPSPKLVQNKGGESRIDEDRQDGISQSGQCLHAPAGFMIAGLSPRSKGLARKPYYAVSENIEYINNYFYCAKTNEVVASSGLQKGFKGGKSNEPCHTHDSFCHDIGVDAVFNSFKFIFSAKRTRQPKRFAQTTRERTVSLGRYCGNDAQSNIWLDPKNALSFRFSKAHGKVDEKSVHGFKPPNLNKP